MFSTNAQAMRNFCIAKFFQSLLLFGCNSLFIIVLSVFGEKNMPKVCFHLFPQVRRPHPLAADDHLLDDGRHWNMRQYPCLSRHPQVIFPVFRKSVFDMIFLCPRNVSMRTSTNFFLFSLAVADIAILLMGEAINSTLLATNLCN